MINKYEIDGVPVTITTNKAGKVTQATVGERGQYLIEPMGNSWHVAFMQQGDYKIYRSSNCYSSRYSGESDLDFIINGLVEDGYYPNCPNWVALNTYTPDFDAPILTRVWSAKYQPQDRLRDKRFNAWNREVRQIVESMSRYEKAFYRELGAPAVEMLNRLRNIVQRVGGVSSIDVLHLPAEFDSFLNKEEHLLCLLFLDIANEISLSNDGFLIDPEWVDPIPRGSCYLEDIISSH